MSLDNFILECEKDNKELEDTIKVLKNKIQRLIRENEELKSLLRGTTHCFDEEEHNKLKEEITNLSKDVDMWNAKYNDMFDENKRLKEALEAKSYCKYANKCDELYDCSREEYEDMSNANVRLSVENYDLKEENQALKKQLEERPKEYVFIGNAQNKTRDFINQNVKENKELKKQVEEIDRKLFFTKNELDMRQKSIDNKLNQQKEFINWLECEVNNYKCKNPLIVENFCTQYDIREIETNMLMKVLNKYKEIIGGNKDEK